MNHEKWINYLLIIVALPYFAFCCDLCHDEIPLCIPKNTFLIWDTIFTDNLDNRGENVVVSTNDSIPKDAYGIRLHFKIQPYLTPPLGSDTCAFLLPADTITDIKIYTLYYFDATHPANSEVSDYFKIATNNYAQGYSYNTFSTISSYLKVNDQSQFYRLDLLLLQSPELNTIHQFKIELVEKHTSLLTSTRPVLLY